MRAKISTLVMRRYLRCLISGHPQIKKLFYLLADRGNFRFSLILKSQLRYSMAFFNIPLTGRLIRAYRAAKGSCQSEYDNAIKCLFDNDFNDLMLPNSYLKNNVQKRPNGAVSALVFIGIIIDYQVEVPEQFYIEVMDDLDDWLFNFRLQDHLETEKVSVKSRRLHGKLLSAKILFPATYERVRGCIKR
ncbi:hypothetical protein HNR62_003230 [Oceanisphaera litoralis]|nr:hypothetical protein [Oceanisphaera litoralis]